MCECFSPTRSPYAGRPRFAVRRGAGTAPWEEGGTVGRSAGPPTSRAPMKRVRRLFGKGHAGADAEHEEGEIVATGDVAHRREGEAVPAEFARPRSRDEIMQDVEAAGFMREDFDAIGHLLVRAAAGRRRPSAKPRSACAVSGSRPPSARCGP